MDFATAYSVDARPIMQALDEAAYCIKNALQNQNGVVARMYKYEYSIFEKA
jgi:hypothetical protein